MNKERSLPGKGPSRCLDLCFFYTAPKLFLFVSLTRIVVDITEISKDSFIANVPKSKRREKYGWAFAADNLLVLERKMESFKRESSYAANDAMTTAQFNSTID